MLQNLKSKSESYGTFGAYFWCIARINQLRKERKQICISDTSAPVGQIYYRHTESKLKLRQSNVFDAWRALFAFIRLTSVLFSIVFPHNQCVKFWKKKNTAHLCKWPFHVYSLRLWSVRNLSCNRQTSCFLLSLYCSFFTAKTMAIISKRRRNTQLLQQNGKVDRWRAI